MLFGDDSHSTILARLTNTDHVSGAVPTGIAGEGWWMRPADIESLTCRVYDLDADPLTPIAEPEIQIADVVLAAPFTNSLIWAVDSSDFNFLHLLDAEVFAEGGRRYRVVYRVETTGGRRGYGVFTGQATPVFAS